MSKFKYSDKEMEINKVLKMNQNISTSLLNDSKKSLIKKDAEDNIAKSISLLNSLGKTDSTKKLSSNIKSSRKDKKITHKPKVDNWDNIVAQSNKHHSKPVILEDIMSDQEIDAAFQELETINHIFSEKTSINNQNDLSFLTIATALQVVKSLLFPHVAKTFNYGESFDSSQRLAHNDSTIESKQRNKNDEFRDKNIDRYGTGHWIEMLYQTPAYDITRGSKDLGINMGGKYHRMHTLGHDPILGWLFGTMNILTDVVTLNTFESYRVTRNPMIISPETVPMGMMVGESYECIRNHSLNLPAAIFAQAQHFKSDEYTKIGLPVPLLSSINEEFSSKLYKNNYDALCAARDIKAVGASFVVSKIIDLIISLVHGLFRPEDESKDLYEVRTRKILLVSNSIASSSTIINASITSNPRNLDIGSLLNTMTRLFTDVRFFTKIKQEYVQNEISDRLKEEVGKINELYDDI